MTYELKKIVKAYCATKAKKIKTVLATVFALVGSSYRKPRLHMLIREDGKMKGTLSSGSGLNIGVDHNEEIALAILAEILWVTRNKEPILLKNKSGRIQS